MLKIFRALSSHYRLQIMELLCEEERRPHEFEEKLQMTRGGLERHLKQLTECGLIEKESFIEEGRAKVKYFLSKEAKEFFENTKEATKTFLETAKTPKSKREQVKLLETRVETLYESIEKVNRLYADQSITERDYLNIKEGYLKELIEIEKDLVRLVQT